MRVMLTRSGLCPASSRASATNRAISTLDCSISAALARDYVTGPWSDAGVPLTILTISLMLAIIGLGIFIARQITLPLQELVSTAQAVTAGDLERRSHVTVRDEVGMLSQSFNEM